MKLINVNLFTEQSASLWRLERRIQNYY